MSAQQQEQQQQQHPPANPSLETLPIELQRLILSSAGSLDVLAAFVHASPQLHATYSHDREAILRKCLARALKGILADAHAAHVSGARSFQLARDEPMLWNFLEHYQQRRKEEEHVLVRRLSLDDLVQMSRFHTSVVEPLVDHYAAWALPVIPYASPACISSPLSQTERRRIQRGIYRLQVHCNMCGSQGEGRSSPCFIQDPEEGTRVLASFPGYETEEMLCIHAFALDKYTSVFRQVAWDLNEIRNPEYKDVVMTAVNDDMILFPRSPGQYHKLGWAAPPIPPSTDAEPDINRPSLNALLYQGPTLLSTVCSIEANHKKLVETVRTGILAGMTHRDRYSNDWLGMEVSQAAQEIRRDDPELYNAYDEAYDNKVKTPFVFDSIDAPPRVWVVMWSGESCNLYGDWVPSYYRRWGYVMWDGWRI
ncbi:hypothetical protein B0H63DRAFT_473990 [Podospora didyma]|uniref:Uncharacterized protein n=1 Tax=Podospora didyma TaxID=330526 RepID=A0AAE0U051_9PEZI|nr:hypothetical protein B0H63DRAFT_473990 [Podospora didyma]